jgi:hypothetical protein
MEAVDVEARRKLVDRLRAGARYRNFGELEAIGIRP